MLAAFYIPLALILLIPRNVYATDIFVIADLKITFNHLNEHTFARLLEEQIRIDLNLIKKVEVIGPSGYEKLPEKLKKGQLVVNLLFGFEDAIKVFLQKYEKFNCSADYDKIVKNQEVDYKFLLSPYFEEQKKFEKLIQSKKVIFRSFWVGGTLKRKYILEHHLKCNLSNFKLNSKKESFSRLLDTISLNDYPIMISNVVNLDLRFPRLEGAKIEDSNAYRVLAKGIVSLNVSELVK